MRTIFIAFLLVACGAPDKNGDGQANLVQQGEPSPSDQQDENQYAQLVADDASLPACDAKMEGRLAYVKDPGEFRACAAGAWSAVDVEGIAGAKGEKGDKGDKGDQGDQGAPGKDGVAAAANTWLDSVSGKTWLIGGSANSLAATQAACTGDWSAASSFDVAVAATHGMFAGFGDMTTSIHECAWSDDNGTPAKSTVATGVSDCNTRAVLGIYCVKDAP